MSSQIIKIKEIKDNNMDKYKIILEEIINISSNISESNKLILNKLDSLEQRIIKIEKKIETKPSKNEIIIENLKELKREDLDISKEDVLKSLTYRDHRSITHLFKLIYRNKMNEVNIYPIKIVGKRSIEYYNNSIWNNDPYGHYSINIIFKNLENLFIKYNNLDNFDYDNFILNQNFINKLSQDKYIKSIFKYIIEEIRISS